MRQPISSSAARRLSADSLPPLASPVAVGDFQVTLVRAGVYYWDGGAIFGVVPKTLWSRQLPADERNLVPLAFNCYVVETGSHTVLIETGGGDKMDARAKERMKLPESRSH
jgi:hypothetical protein